MVSVKDKISCVTWHSRKSMGLEESDRRSLAKSVMENCTQVSYVTPQFLNYFGHLMQSTSLLEKDLMLGKD